MTDTVTRPRIAPGNRKDTGLIGWTICQVAGRANGTGPPNLLTTMARQRPLFRNWLRFASRLMPAGRLPRRETELVILRVAHLRSIALHGVRVWIYETVLAASPPLDPKARFIAAKHSSRKSPYAHLLAPRSGGIAYVVEAMGDVLDGVIDV